MPGLRSHFRLTVSTLALLLVTACATPPRQPPESDFSLHQKQLQALDNWQVEGKIGLRSDGRGNSAQLSWQQQQDHYKLRLSGPLGIGTVLVDGNDHGVQLRTRDGVYRAASPELLLEQLTGWQIPVSALQFWARGLPSPDLPIQQQRVELGRLANLQQGGWHIDYLDFTRIDDLWLPRKMVMNRPQTRLTLLYHNWQFKRTR
jgi:outer membrane lipoprotein LolB